MEYDYDIIVLGGGPAGLVAAKVACGLGKRVALIEAHRLGGTCTLTGCVPSKTLIHVAKLAHDSLKMKEFGVGCSGKLDTRKIMTFVRAKIEEIYQGHSTQALETLGIHVLYGKPAFINKNQVQLAEHNANSMRILTAKKYIIATGSRPFIPPIEGLTEVPYLTNETLFNLEELPESLIILGGGPIGVEIAACLQRLGTKCTIIERSPLILSKEDPELARLVLETMTDEGVTIKTTTTAQRVSLHRSGIALTCTDASGNEIEIIGQQLLIAVGRVPNADTLHLEKAGVVTHRSGIMVTKTLQTTTPTIYACGDVVGPYQFSHMAEYQASIAAQNACLPFLKKRTDYTYRIWVTFTDPELATM